jgi:hypothetical protein
MTPGVSVWAAGSAAKSPPIKKKSLSESGAGPRQDQTVGIAPPPIPRALCSRAPSCTLFPSP